MSRRCQALRTALGETGYDALVSLDPADNQYLTGFLGTASAVIVTQSEALFLCDFRYTEQAGDQVQNFVIEEVKGSLAERAGERLRTLGVKTPCFDPARLTVDALHRLATTYEAELDPAPDIVGKLRIVKTAEEIQAIRNASQLAEGVLADIIETLEKGLEERELAARFEYEFKRRGATGASFDTIALFGSRSSLPHGAPEKKTLAAGDVVLLDFGCRKRGYCSDLTRTYCFGRIPGTWFDEAYEVVLRAQTAAVEAVRPGMSSRELDGVARNVIAQAGYGERFGHGLGHGVGVEIHESPKLNTETDTALEEGMVFTVEPGVYVPGKGGIRIEDLVMVTRDGCEVLSAAPRELTILKA
ncbi:MAG TPA: aminopeptidase P family protein [Candidatus Hydrogenedentes bacterium]|nr:aminopeptidase P family protein [Candidatus Hydrogenedentota bacterium]